MPAGRQRSRFGLAVAHHTANQQIRIVKHGAGSMDDRVAQFPALVNRTGRLRRDMAGNPSGKRELLEEALHPFFGLRNVGIDFAVGALEIGVRDHPRPAVARPGNIDGVQIKLFDGAIHVHINEVQAGRSAPVAQQARLDVLDPQRLVEHRIGQQIDLPHREIIRGAPVGVHPGQLFLRENTLRFDGFGRIVCAEYMRDGHGTLLFPGFQFDPKRRTLQTDETLRRGSPLGWEAAEAQRACNSATGDAEVAHLIRPGKNGPEQSGWLGRTRMA